MPEEHFEFRQGRGVDEGKLYINVDGQEYCLWHGAVKHYYEENGFNKATFSANLQLCVDDIGRDIRVAEERGRQPHRDTMERAIGERLDFKLRGLGIKSLELSKKHIAYGTHVGTEPRELRRRQRTRSGGKTTATIIRETEPEDFLGDQ